MKGLIRGGAPMLGMAMLLTAIGGNAAAQGQPGNDSADWCLVSAGACAGKDKTVSVTPGESESFTGRLISPDKLNAGDTPDWARWLSMTVILAVTPFHASGPCRLRVVAETESETLESGQFMIDRMR